LYQIKDSINVYLLLLIAKLIFLNSQDKKHQGSCNTSTLHKLLLS